MKIVIFLFLMTLYSYTFADEETGGIEPFIVGGEGGEIHDFPFMVSIQSEGAHFCGGSLIHAEWVITAAHCVRFVNLEKLEIVLGADRLQVPNSGERHRVNKIIIHPKFGIVNPRDYDFALLKLNEKSFFKPIRLQEVPLEIPENENHAPMVTVAGWGALIEDGLNTVFLRKVELPLVSQNRCERVYPDYITDQMFCAGFVRGGKDSCQEDSGGPLIVGLGRNPVLAGIVSWGNGCGKPGQFGVYAKISSVVNWVKSNYLKLQP